MQRENAEKIKYSLLFVSGKKAILSFERCAIDSEWLTAQSATIVYRIRRSVLSDTSLSKHSRELFSPIYL